jgi:hypothetical protein
MGRGRIRELALIAVCAAVVASCGKPPVEWQEDVLQPDGSKLTVTRHYEYDSPGYGGEPFADPSAGSSWLTFKDPNTGEVIKWEDGGGGHFFMVGLVYDGKTPLMLVMPARGGDMQHYGCPNPPYLVYAYQGRKWLSRPMASWPVKVFRANFSTLSDSERKDAIQQYGSPLPVEVTQRSVVLNSKPWIIHFEGAPPQMFNPQNCNFVNNYLIEESPSSN